MHTPASGNWPRIHNRIGAIMIHTSKYSCFGPSRLASDAGVSVSAVSRLIHGRTIPTTSVLARVMVALTNELGYRLPLDEVISLTGKYPTRNICDLLKCRNGCLPGKAWEENNDPKPEWWCKRGGNWTGDVAEQGLEENLIPIEEVRQ